LTRATESCCRQSLPITAINYSGRASELGGIVDGPVYHVLSVHLSRGELITRFDDRYTKAKFSKSGVWNRVPEGSTLIFWSEPNFPLTQCRMGGRKLPCPKPSSIHPAVSMELRLVTDRQTYGQTDTWP